MRAVGMIEKGWPVPAVARRLGVGENIVYVWVESDGGASGRRVAGALAEALAAMGRRFPRGPLPADVGAQQLQWRGVGAARGELFEGDGYAVSYEGRGALRLGPGYRNVWVLCTSRKNRNDSIKA